MVTVMCLGGPMDQKVVKYPRPVPKTIVFVDDSLHYQEYVQSKNNTSIYTYNGPVPKPEE
jgi:hypothetical protein